MKLLIVDGRRLRSFAARERCGRERSHRGGISLRRADDGRAGMEDAVKRARTMPALGVGLHVTLLDGRPVLPPERGAGSGRTRRPIFERPVALRCRSLCLAGIASSG